MRKLYKSLKKFKTKIMLLVVNTVAAGVAQGL